jgi:hypothetical protein
LGIPEKTLLDNLFETINHGVSSNQTNGMSKTIPKRNRTKIIAIVLVLLIIAALTGAYLAFLHPAAEKTRNRSFAVESNKVVLVKLPGLNSSAGIWKLNMTNGGNATAYVNYEIYLGGNLGYGNSSKLPPGQNSNVTACLGPPITKSTTFEVPIFVTNSSGTSSAYYPVALSNATQVPFSGQFSASNKLEASVYNKQFQGNFSSWSITLTNTGAKPILFVFAELWNSTSLLGVSSLLCNLAQVPNNAQPLSQPLAVGHSVNTSRISAPLHANETFKVDVVAAYSDFSEVVQTYEVQSTA